MRSHGKIAEKQHPTYLALKVNSGLGILLYRKNTLLYNFSTFFIVSYFSFKLFSFSSHIVSRTVLENRNKKERRSRKCHTKLTSLSPFLLATLPTLHCLSPTFLEVMQRQKEILPSFEEPLHALQLAQVKGKGEFQEFPFCCALFPFFRSKDM